MESIDSPLAMTQDEGVLLIAGVISAFSWVTATLTGEGLREESQGQILCRQSF
jgi:hypothetical protein